jgi:hypothetical protein
MNERLAVAAIGAGIAIFIAYQAVSLIVATMARVTASFAGLPQ